jgi:hypothetical protein
MCSTTLRYDLRRLSQERDAVLGIIHAVDCVVGLMRRGSEHADRWELTALHTAGLKFSTSMPGTCPTGLSSCPTTSSCPGQLDIFVEGRLSYSLVLAAHAPDDAHHNV